jgi:WD40 repeat protein
MKREPKIPERRSGYQNDSEEDDGDQSPERSMPTHTEYPDSSQANRRPPRFKERPYEIYTKYETKLFAILGEFVCTTGYVTRVWNVTTGELLMSLSHGETVKATALSFKPAEDRDDEGKRIWIGTNVGELMEIDIPTQSVIINKPNAHTRSSVTKIHRHAAEMWTLDDEGKLLVWPPGEDGSASLGNSPIVSRLPSGSQYCIIVGGMIWIAYGKEIIVFQHNEDSRTLIQVTPKSLYQETLGEVTCGTLVSSQPDRIYFGHNDGRVTIYSRKDYSCLGVINISTYKISSLVGVGDYLWAGFNTGMIYVYDMSGKPWKVMKDWKAHEGTIAGILVDSTSMWKLDRLQVASLGTDGAIRFWDGMLSEDWLGKMTKSFRYDMTTWLISLQKSTCNRMTPNTAISEILLLQF